MFRQFFGGVLSSGSSTSVTIIPTADLFTDHSAAIQFLVISSTGSVSVKIRSVDNDVEVSGEMFAASDDTVGSINLPQGQIPWFIGPQGDGLEVFVTAETTLGSIRWNIHVGVEQYNNRVLEVRTDQEEIP